MPNQVVQYGAPSGGGVRAVDWNAPYNPGDLQEIDKAIRHLPFVVSHMVHKAHQLISETGSTNYEVVLQNEPTTQRPRAYVAPANDQGIHQELSEHLALKAAINMEGQ